MQDYGPKDRSIEEATGGADFLSSDFCMGTKFNPRKIGSVHRSSREMPLSCRCLFQGHAVVVERRSAVGCGLIRPGESIDAAAADMSAVRPNRFRDQHTAPDSVVQTCMDVDLTARILQPHQIAVGNALRR